MKIGQQKAWDDEESRLVLRDELEVAHERFEAVLDGLDAAVFVADVHTDEILFANLAFKKKYGFDVVGHSTRGALITQPERGDYRIDLRRLVESDVPCELFDGELQDPLSGHWYHIREQAIRWVDSRIVRMGIATDITVHKLMKEVERQQEARLQRTARLVTMGEMASSLAHELNQPLAAIVNYCAGCVARLEGGQATTEEMVVAMKKAGSQAERAGTIIRRIRDFVKKSEPQRNAVQIAAMLEEVLSFAEIDASRLHIRLVMEIEPDLPAVFADRIMVEQVVLNLIRNGLDAMADEVDDLSAEACCLVIRARRLGEEAVEVAVIDRGHGIDEEMKALLFSSFYTTKAEGMGMGLNICRSIIEFHDGRLKVETNPEGGAIFSFTLPVENAFIQEE